MTLFYKKRNTQFVLVLVLIFFLTGFSATAQHSETCIGKELYRDIYPKDLSEISNLLAKKRWLLLSNETDVSLILNQNSVSFNLAIWKNTSTSEEHYLYLYYKNSHSHYLELTTTAHCFEQLLSHTRLSYGKSEETSTNDNITKNSYQISDDLTVVFTQKTGNTQTHTITCFNKRELDSLVVWEKEWQIAQEELRRKKEEEVKTSITLSDSYLKKENYQTALLVLDTLSDIPQELQSLVKEKKSHIKELIKRAKIAELTATGETLFEKKDYQTSLKKYQEVLTLDKKNETANIRISQITKILDVLSSRSTTLYDYQIINPDNYYMFKNQLTELVNQGVNRYPSGKLIFKYNIQFDTLGSNRSLYDWIENTLPATAFSLEELSRNSLLSPSYKESVLVASQSMFNVDVRWNSFDYTIRKTATKLRAISSQRIEKENHVSKYLNDAEKPKGRYFFTVKEKSLGQKQLYADISLTKYKTVGPEAMFYSMLMPGLGTLIATQGDKGAGAMISVFALAGGGIGSLYYSKHLEKKAETDKNSDPENYDKRAYDKKIKNSKIFKYGGYSLFAVGGVVHFSDIINALVKGSKNLKASKELRKALRHAPIEILKEDIVL